MMSSRGDNNPPDMTVTAQDTATDISEWMAAHPVIQTEDDAREAKVFIDRGKLCLKDLEDERDGKVRPLNEQVKAINNSYRPSRETLAGILDVLELRVGGFLFEQEQQRIAEAQAAARRAEEAERLAREAERTEQEALAEAKGGTLDIDIKAIVQHANEAFADYKKAAHRAALAEKETKVKIGGGFTRSIGLKNQETLILVDAHEALTVIGVTEDIENAILKSARAYRKINRVLPAGVELKVERKI